MSDVHPGLLPVPSCVPSETPVIYLSWFVFVFFARGRLHQDEDGGCAQPWCHEKADGLGIRGQGWERNCVHLCKEAAPLAPGINAKPSAAVRVHGEC